MGDENNPEQLPPNRKKEWLFLLKEHYGKIFVASCFTLIFFLPAYIFFVLMSFSYNSIAEPTSGDTLSFILTTFSINIPLSMIASLGLGSLFGYFKRMVRGESLDFGEYFAVIKDNWARLLFLGFAFGVLLFVTAFACTYYSLSTLDTFPKYLLIGASILLFVLLFGYGMVLLFFQLHYDLTLKSWFSDGGKLYLHRSLMYILFSLGLIFLYDWPFFLSGVLQVLFLSINVLFLVAPISLLFSLYVAFRFDEDINKKLFPKEYRKGLRKGSN